MFTHTSPSIPDNAKESRFDLDDRGRRLYYPINVDEHDRYFISISFNNNHPFGISFLQKLSGCCQRAIKGPMPINVDG